MSLDESLMLKASFHVNLFKALDNSIVYLNN